MSTSTWQTPIHICQRQWAESNRWPIIHMEPCKAVETAGLNRVHTELHRHTHEKTQTTHHSISPPGERFDRTRGKGKEREGRASAGREDERASVSSPLTTEWLKRNKMFPSTAGLHFRDGGKQLLSRTARTPRCGASVLLWLLLMNCSDIS